MILLLLLFGLYRRATSWPIIRSGPQPAILRQSGTISALMKTA